MKWETYCESFEYTSYLWWCERVNLWMNSRVLELPVSDWRILPWKDIRRSDVSSLPSQHLAADHENEMLVAKYHQWKIRVGSWGSRARTMQGDAGVQEFPYFESPFTDLPVQSVSPLSLADLSRQAHHRVSIGRFWGSFSGPFSRRHRCKCVLLVLCKNGRLIQRARGLGSV